MKLYHLIMILVFTLTASTVDPQTAKLINRIAGKALDEENFVIKDGIAKLYGIRTNGPDTKYGELACAKVVTIILHEAGVVEKTSVGVRHVETAIKKWEKIENKKDLKPGDIIVWVFSCAASKDKKCTGGGNCHVGIVTEKGYFHNSPISNIPTFGGISLWAFKFKMGYRPTD